MAAFKPGDGPIAGANYTSDTKNYPWHQPPQFTDLNKALDMMSEKMTEKKTASSLLTMVELGSPLYKITSTLLVSGIAGGKWTPDFALLLAGPVCRILEIICVAYGVEYTLGIEDDEELATGAFFNTINSPSGQPNVQVINEGVDQVKADAEEKTEPNLGSMGFMREQTSGKGEVQ